MFSRLRSRFLALHMLITSTVMIAAFATVYLITRNNINSEIEKRLKAYSGTINVVVDEGGERVEPGDPDIVLQPEIGKGTAIVGSNVQTDIRDDFLTFTIEVDREGNIMRILSPFDIPEEAYHEAAETAWANRNRKTSVTLEGRQWRYSVGQAATHVIRADGREYTLAGDGYGIVFVDVTESNRTLFQLLTTLVGVGLVVLLLIFLISRYFSERTIRPIAEAWNRQKQFVADASHELKTPLSIVTANYDVLAANQDETIRSQSKWLDAIRAGTDQMAKLVNNLLSLARMDDLNWRSRKVQFDMSEAVEAAVSLMDAHAVDKGITISRSIGPDITAQGDPGMVMQVLSIMLDNAIKYSDENGRIEVSLTGLRGNAVCSVRNTGPGISPKDLPRVFDRFYRADSARTHGDGGYGLGLSIAKAIVENLGGQIHAESVEGESATFTFTLKRASTC